MKELLTEKRTQLILLACLIFLGLFVYVIVSRQSSPNRTIIKVDKDTGETLISEPNKTAEQFNGIGSIMVLGAPNLIDRGLTQGQFDLFRDNVEKYVKQHFSQYDRVKILPNELSGVGTEITGDLRLGESESVLEFRLKVYDLYFIELSIHDPKNQAPDLVTGKLEASSVTEEYEEDEF